MLIDDPVFYGIRPAIEPPNLPAGHAVAAQDAKLWTGALTGYRNARPMFTLAKPTTPLTIYRYARQDPDETRYWFHWPSRVQVIRSPTASSDDELTYFLENGQLRETDLFIATPAGSQQYPVSSRSVGIPVPTSAPGVTVSGSPSSAEANAYDRAFVYTYVDERGREGPPSAPSALTQGRGGQTYNLSGLHNPITWDHTVTAKRIYVTEGSGTGANFFFAGEIVGGQTTFSMPVLAVATMPGEPIPTQNHLPPPDGMTWISMLPSGAMVGIKDFRLHYSEPGFPHAWNPFYEIALQRRPVAVGVLDQTHFVLTDNQPYQIDSTIPGEMFPRDVPLSQGCVSPRSVVQIDGGVGYCGPDGFCILTATNAEAITLPTWTPDQWRALSPSTMHAVYWGTRIVLFYGPGPADPTASGAILLERNAAPVTLSTWSNAAYVDPMTNFLYLAQGRQLLRADDGDRVLPFDWTSKEHMAPSPTNFGALKVWGRDLNAVLELTADGIVRASIPITSSRPMRLPSGYKAERWQYRIRGHGTIERVQIATRLAELAAQ